VTERLRAKVAEAIAAGNRAVSEVAGEYGVSWPTAHRALIAAAARWLPEPTPTRRLGIDETRFRSVRWILDGVTWKRSDPWLTSFVDCSRDGPGSLLGLSPGRTGGCLREWLAEQTAAFRDTVELVVIDPSAPYAAGIRAALPKARIAVDRWHLVALANTMITEVRQRVTRDLLGRRGTVADPVWVNRRLLLTGAEHLSTKQWKRLQLMLDSCDPTKEIGAAWGVKERLRLLLGEHEPSKIRWRLADFYDAAIHAQLPEATRLADTIQTWWPAILVALTEDASNARTEGSTASSNCPASRKWQDFKPFKGGDGRAGEAEMYFPRPVPRQRLVWSDRVELDSELLGMAGQVKHVDDVFTVEPLVLQRLKRPLPHTVLAWRLDPGANVPQLGMGGNERGESKRPERAPVVGHQNHRGDLTGLCVGDSIKQRRAEKPRSFGDG
jgi:transposase